MEINMSLKSRLVAFWNDEVCDGVNRRALKSYVRASALWHKGGLINQLRAMLLNRHNTIRYGCDIYPQAVLGEGLYIPHFVGITIGNTTVLGKNCTIFPNVVFGASYSPNRDNPSGRRHAKCGDNCVFGANASIIGAITIGSNVTIGAGAIVTKDVPDNVTVVGVNHIVESNLRRGR